MIAQLLCFFFLRATVIRVILYDHIRVDSLPTSKFVPGTTSNQKKARRRSGNI